MLGRAHYREPDHRRLRTVQRYRHFRKLWGLKAPYRVFWFRRCSEAKDERELNLQGLGDRLETSHLMREPVRWKLESARKRPKRCLRTEHSAFVVQPTLLDGRVGATIEESHRVE